MQYPATSTGRVWTLGRWTAVLILVLVAVGLAPPGSLPYPPESGYSDAAISHWPNAHFLRESVRKYGEWPLWNPLRMLGQPFAANPLSKVWYPPQWLALIFPPTFHLNLMLYLHMAWLALGMFAWMRSERVRPSTALFAAIAWGLTPKLMGHLGAGHLDIVYALAWVPWLLWASRHVVDTPSMGWGALAGGIAAMLALADMRIAFYMLPVAAVYAVAAAIAVPRPLSSSWRAWVLAVLSFLLLTAVQTVPLLALSPDLTRARLTPHEAAVFSLPMHYLLGLLIPDVGGFQEWMTYLSLPVLGLAILALAQRKARGQVWLWWGMAVLAVLWALGENGPLFLPVVERLPLAGWFRVPSRAWFVAALSLVIAGAYGLEDLLEHGLGKHGRLVTLALAFAGAVWCVSAPALPGLPPVLVGTGAAVSGTSIGLWLAGGGLADLAAFLDQSARRRGRLVGIGVLLVTLTLSLLGVDATLVRARSMADIERPEQAIIDQIDGSCGSTFSPTFSLIGPATARARIATLHGVDPFQLRWSAESIAAAAGVGLDGYSVIVPPLPPGEIDLKDVSLNVDVLQRLGVCRVVAGPGLLPQGMQLAAQTGDISIYRLPAERLEAGVTIIDSDLSAGNNAFEAEVCSDARLGQVVIRQAWAPGWLARVDGKPASTAAWNGLLAVEMKHSSGCHVVEVAYRPPADFIGMAVTGMTVVALAGWLVFHRRHVR